MSNEEKILAMLERQSATLERLEAEVAALKSRPQVNPQASPPATAKVECEESEKSHSNDDPWAAFDEFYKEYNRPRLGGPRHSGPTIHPLLPDIF